MIQEAVDLVKHFEGFRAKPYLCPSDVWTIGFGTTWYPSGRRVSRVDPSCTQEQAEVWLRFVLEEAEQSAISLCRVYLSPFQRGALASFIYNVGEGAFRASTLRKRINDMEWEDVPFQFRRWKFAGGRVLGGLVRRREAEIGLWERGLKELEPAEPKVSWYDRFSLSRTA